MRLFYFEKLDVWKLSIKLTKLVYKLTKVFSDKKIYSLSPLIEEIANKINSLRNYQLNRVKQLNTLSSHN